MYEPGAEGDGPSVADVTATVLRECRRENVPHKIEAVKCAGIVAAATHVDCFTELASIVFPTLDKVRSLLFIDVLYEILGIDR